MKKVLNLSVILAVLMAAFSFSSCTSDPDNTVTVTLDKTKLTVGEAVTGAIESDADLDNVTLLKDGQTVAGYPTSDFKAGNPISGADGVYAIRITGLGEGSYTLRATDKDGKEDSKSFTVGTEEPVLDWTKAVSKITANGTYAYKQGDYEGTLVVSGISATSVTVNLDEIGDVILSDEGNSYLMIDGRSANRTTALANAADVLLAKLSSKSEVVSIELTGSPIEGAAPVLFLKK